MQRYFGVNKIDSQMILQASDLYHIKTVMRMKENDSIEVVYHQELFLCRIHYEKDEVTVMIMKQLEVKPDFMRPVVLVIPVLKEQKMDFILQKATELGVSEIIPVEMKRSIVKINDKKEKKLERWNRIMKEASEQSMRHIVPYLHPVTTLEAVKKLDGLKIICSTRENTNTFKNLLQTASKYDKLIIVVGPEGGITPSEEEELVLGGFVPVTLGPRVMRVETVPIYVLSVLNYEYME